MTDKEDPKTLGDLVDKWGEYCVREDKGHVDIYAPVAWVPMIDLCLTQCARLHVEVEEPFQILQVKVKFSSLRIYLEYSDYAIETSLNVLCNNVITLAEHACHVMCKECGSMICEHPR